MNNVNNTTEGARHIKINAPFEFFFTPDPPESGEQTLPAAKLARTYFNAALKRSLFRFIWLTHISLVLLPLTRESTGAKKVS